MTTAGDRPEGMDATGDEKTDSTHVRAPGYRTQRPGGISPSDCVEFV